MNFSALLLIGFHLLSSLVFIGAMLTYFEIFSFTQNTKYLIYTLAGIFVVLDMLAAYLKIEKDKKTND